MPDAQTDLGHDIRAVARKLLKGMVVPLLGAGVNACGRPPDFTWQLLDKQHLPTGSELATYLAKEFDAPEELAKTADLTRVSQFIDSVESSGGELYQALHDIFDADYHPGTGARLPRADRAAPPRAQSAPGDPDHELRRRARTRIRAGRRAVRPDHVHRVEPEGVPRPLHALGPWRAASAAPSDRERKRLSPGPGEEGRDPQAPRCGPTAQTTRGRQLRHHRRPLHRVPDAHGHQRASSRASSPTSCATAATSSSATA